MVNARFGPQVCVEAVERAVCGKTQTGSRIAVLQDARRGKDLEDLVVLVHVEVACHHHGRTLGDLANLSHDKLGSLTTGHDAHMIHVEVEMEEAQARCLLLKLTPCADANADGIPSQLRRVGGLVKPEIAVVQQLQVILLIKDGGILARLLAVVAAHTNEVVVVERSTHVAQLSHKHLLGAEHVGSLKVYHVTHNLAACSPHVTVFLVAVVAVTDIVRAHIQVLCAHDHCKEQGNSRKNYSSHNYLKLFFFIFLCFALFCCFRLLGLLLSPLCFGSFHPLRLVVFTSWLFLIF